MNQLFKDRPLAKTAILGLILLPFLFLMNEYSPPQEKIPEGYSSSILAFEFASDEAELNEVLGTLTMSEMKDLDRLNYVDFGFMIIYGLFLFTFLSVFSGLIDSALLSKVKFLIPIAVVFDALENLQLLKLTTAFSLNSVHQADFHWLSLFTWGKWLILAIALSCIGYQMIQMTLKSKISGYILLLPIALAVGALIYSNRLVEDYFGTSVFLGFFLLFIYSIFYRSEVVKGAK